jgi:quercetin dioxygenase-like cupin family protein
MLSRRLFSGCALCAAIGFAASPARAQPAAVPGGVLRTVIRQEPLAGTNQVTIQAFVELTPGAVIARHTHPGHEGSYVIEGALDFEIDGQPKLALKAGDSFLVPAGVPHGGTNGPARSRLFATYVVDKDKPLASPA